MVVQPTNATGWAELMNGNPVTASRVMFDAALHGYFVVILFIIFEMLLYYKTRNYALCWVTTAMFTGLMYSYMPIPARNFIFLMLAMSLAFVIYFYFLKE